jgi:hypothetical protein
LNNKRGLQEACTCNSRPAKKKRGYMVCTGNYIATNTRKQKGLLEVQRKTVGRQKKRGYMVCTGDYVATNTRKQKRAARSSAKTGCHPKEAHPEKASVCET